VSLSEIKNFEFDERQAGENFGGLTEKIIEKLFFGSDVIGAIRFGRLCAASEVLSFLGPVLRLMFWNIDSEGKRSP
jgi:hypothetical protein